MGWITQSREGAKKREVAWRPSGLAGENSDLEDAGVEAGLGYGAGGEGEGAEEHRARVVRLEDGVDPASGGLRYTVRD